MATWRLLIQWAMDNVGDSFDEVVGWAAKPQPNYWSDEDHEKNPAPYESDEWLDIEFNKGYGTAEGCSFTLWTKNRVYFPVCYDGAEWASSVPRNVTDEICGHVGCG